MNKESALEILIRCVVKGQSNGVFSIRDSSSLYDIILHLRGTKTNDEFVEKDCFMSLTRAVIASHTKGVFALEESSIIDKTIKWLSENDLIDVEDGLPKKEKLEMVPEEKEV
jgi:hypothetical protein